MDYAFTPTLTLQLYAQPFLSAGRYRDFKRIADPMAERYVDRFSGLAARRSDGEIFVDADGDGVDESFDIPDFNYKQFRSNAVLRWEYEPGSTLFLVWSQGRNRSVPDGSFDFAGDLRNLFAQHPDNVFMIKVSYWMNP
jgi:hypothetical protein